MKFNERLILSDWIKNPRSNYILSARDALWFQKDTNILKVRGWKKMSNGNSSHKNVLCLY